MEPHEPAGKEDGWTGKILTVLSILTNNKLLL